MNVITKLIVLLMYLRNLPRQFDYAIIVRRNVGLFWSIVSRGSKALPLRRYKGSRTAIMASHRSLWDLLCVPSVDRRVRIVRIKIDVHRRDQRVAVSECGQQIRIVLRGARTIELGPAFVPDL